MRLGAYKVDTDLSVHAVVRQRVTAMRHTIDGRCIGFSTYNDPYRAAAPAPRPAICFFQRRGIGLRCWFDVRMICATHTLHLHCDAGTSVNHRDILAAFPHIVHAAKPVNLNRFSFAI